MGSFFGDTATTTTSTTTSTSTTSSPSSSPAMDQNRRELVFKILVVGDIGAGKTAIIRRAVDNVFSDAYKVKSPLIPRPLPCLVQASSFLSIPRKLTSLSHLCCRARSVSTLP
jgi:GTPase SAR1 family protein